MCGRFVAASPPDEIARYFDAALAPAARVLEASYNVAPTDPVLAVTARDDGVRLVSAYRWGLVPPWAEDLKVGARMINARAETVATRGAFAPASAQRRCILPMDGFFEWRRTTVGKQPVFVHRADGEPLAVAGLWETWPDPTGGVVHSVAVVTTEANAVIAEVHDRMPVVLAPSAWGSWLDPASPDTAALRSLLSPAPDSLLTFHPVSGAVNFVANRGPELVAPVAPAEYQPSLL